MIQDIKPIIESLFYILIIIGLTSISFIITLLLKKGKNEFLRGIKEVEEEDYEGC